MTLRMRLPGRGVALDPAVGPITVALGTVSLDFLFHYSLTSPMEVPLYFLAKFAVAYAVACLLVFGSGSFLKRNLAAASLFTLVFDIYYAVGVLLLHIPGLSSSPNQVIEIAGFGAQCPPNYGMGAACNLLPETLILMAAWTFIHGAFFFVAGYMGLAVSILRRHR